MSSIPKQIDRADVMFYAVISSEIKPTGNCKQIVAGVLQGPAPVLAICQYPGEKNFYLFSCDENWQSITALLHESEVW